MFDRNTWNQLTVCKLFVYLKKLSFTDSSSNENDTFYIKDMNALLGR